jgi:hypothetical protein
MLRLSAWFSEKTPSSRVLCESTQGRVDANLPVPPGRMIPANTVCRSNPTRRDTWSASGVEPSVNSSAYILTGVWSGIRTLRSFVVRGSDGRSKAKGQLNSVWTAKIDNQMA